MSRPCGQVILGAELDVWFGSRAVCFSGDDVFCQFDSHLVVILI